MNFYDALRVLNMTGAIFALWLLATGAHRYWASWNRKTQAHWWALFGWVFLCMEGSIEVLILDVEGGPRIVLTTLVVAWTVRALLIQEEINARPSLPWKDRK